MTTTQSPDEALRERLQSLLQSAMPEDVMKVARRKIDDVFDEISDRFWRWIKDEMASELASYAADMAKEIVEEIIAGDEDKLRRLLRCKEGEYTGRDGDHFVSDNDGKLYEVHALRMRRRIVDAYPDLLKNERILDLEDQVRGLVKQVTDLRAELERERSR